MQLERGSRRHVLDWTESPQFSTELEQLTAPLSVRVAGPDCWMPRGRSAPCEARLGTFRPYPFRESCPWSELRGWWLAHPRGANTPNWDLACAAYINDEPGLILVEAKAHTSELSSAGKPPCRAHIGATAENHGRIGAAIGEASDALRSVDARVNLQRDAYYQLSNRIAFAWKLASLGVPTVLVYLGFLGDGNVRGPEHALKGDGHWQRVFREHAESVWPDSLLEDAVPAGTSSFWVLVRSRWIGDGGADVRLDGLHFQGLS